MTDNMKKNAYPIFERDTYTRADYDLWLADNDLNPNDFNDEEFYAWQLEEESMDFDIMLDNFKYSGLMEYSAVINGTLGLWDGKKTIRPTMSDNIKTALYSCGGCGEVEKIWVEGNSICVKVSHHDGTNFFTINLLTPLGEMRMERHGNVSVRNRENIVKLPKPHIFA